MFRWLKKLFGPQEIIVTVRGSLRLEGDREGSPEPYWDREPVVDTAEEQSAILPNGGKTEEALPPPAIFTGVKMPVVSFGQDAQISGRQEKDL